MRSPEAHAKIVSIDSSAAKARPGVHAVFTDEDLDSGGPLPMAWVPPGVEVNNPDHWPLAKGAVKHVGDPVAVVIGSDRYAVVDATEDVSSSTSRCRSSPTPRRRWRGARSSTRRSARNKVHEWSLSGGDLDAGFAEADVVVERRVVNHRTAGGAIEPRGVLADYRARLRSPSGPRRRCRTSCGCSSRSCSG